MNGAAPRPPDGSFRFRIARRTAFLLLVVFTIGNQAVVIPKIELHWWTDLWWTFTSLFAALLSFDAARRLSAAYRRAWIFFGFGCLSWAMGMIAWDVYELAFNWITPFPSLADLGYSGFSILILAGCFFITNTDQSVYERTRLFLDSLILINVLILALVVLFQNAVFHAPMSVTGKVAALFYPIVPISAGYVLWVIRSRMNAGPHRQSLDWVLAGMLLTAAANMGYLVPIITGGYAVGSLLDPLWIGAFLCIGLGAFTARPFVRSSASEASGAE